MARTHGHGNPKWSRDETILALDLYFELNGNIPSREDVRVQELSLLLRTLPYHEKVARKESFRNPDGVAFKLQNIRNVATGKGLGNVSETDRQIWAELGAYPARVKSIAASIRAGAKTAASLTGGSAEDLDDEFFEGRVLTQIHKKKERNPKIRGRLLRERRKHGPLRCEMCNTYSSANAPSLDDAMFEAHHLVPLGMAVERNTRIADLALLCANCHRLVHRAISLSKRWLDIGEARKYLSMGK